MFKRYVRYQKRIQSQFSRICSTKQMEVKHETSALTVHIAHSSISPKPTAPDSSCPDHVSWGMNRFSEVREVDWNCWRPIKSFYLERVRLYPFIIPVQLQQGLISTYDDHAWRDKFVTYTLGLKQTCQMWWTKFYIKERLRGSLLHICVLKITLWGTLNNSYKKKKKKIVCFQPDNIKFH